MQSKDVSEVLSVAVINKIYNSSAVW